MSDKQNNAEQRIIEQDNALINRLIQELDAAAQAWDDANWATWDATDTEDAQARASALDDTYAAYQHAQAELSKQIRSFWRAGYRLCRDT